MNKLQYNGPETDALKPGQVYDRDAHPETDDECWATPAAAEPAPRPKSAGKAKADASASAD